MNYALKVSTWKEGKCVCHLLVFYIDVEVFLHNLVKS